MNLPNSGTVSETPTEPVPNEIVEAKTNDASDWPASGQAEPSAASEVHKEEVKSPLQMAVLEPDIGANPADRERAIILRWALRDIKSKRLKLSPIDPQTLQALIDMRFVEMRNDAPVLTNVGLDAITPRIGHRALS
jgi:hypothetical protein